MDKEYKKILILIAIFTFLLGVMNGLLLSMWLIVDDTSSETFNESCTISSSDKTYEHCLIIEHDKESGFIEFKCDGKDICVHGPYTIIKESE